MDNKILIKAIGFKPKENTTGIFQKKYNRYAIEVDFNNESINFGKKIKSESKTTQNFSQAENWVILECVDRLLEKGYLPENIKLEKTWKTGHGTSGCLDILISRDDGSAYLMIECKTWGAEFDKAFKYLGKNGGQLFTYFQQDKDADVLLLYTSALDGKLIKFRNKIVKIEEDYRRAGNVKDFFERWNKLPKSNGIFDNWVLPYEFQSKALTKKDLKILKQEDSSFIFNRFLEILRHNVVSDKPNAFNKIFTLFLCKIVDENRADDEQLHFQWFEGKDSHISFQKRLTDLYRRGMKELLEKNVTDVSDAEFDKRFQQVQENYRDEIKDILTEIRLKKNNEFAIKEVFDDASFNENAKVVKEVVELLQVYQIRYNYRQQFLSDFFELLLTTGLKQESGQFFTPVPIARFIIKSLPLQEIAAKKIAIGNKKDFLPRIIDYAAGSGHFLTESMEEIQKYIDKLALDNYKPKTRKQLAGFQTVQFDWAEEYVYGIEKDYRLVKTAKVSCYLHGDGLAKVIHGDGLGDFSTSTDFKDLLKESDKTYPQDNKQFDVIISNPPYSVSSFKGLMDSERSAEGFNLFNRLTDQSSEIECLFIERTKQLLKDGGVAGIILPSSILSNTGIYTQSREILLKYFEVLAIAELGSNTFMATGTNTVTLFLRRRNNGDAYNIGEAVKTAFVNHQDVTINGIEKPIAKYLAHVWDAIAFKDYVSLMQGFPNEKISQHEIYLEYKKKIKAKGDREFMDAIVALEQEKLIYFILAFPQILVHLKTGSKNDEKRFLGYEFSNRRGSEGIHPIQRSKTIDDCTQLYDAENYSNPEKASTYIYKAFKNEFNLEIPESLKKNISYHSLVDLLTFDRVDFEKNISLNYRKKVKFEELWNTSKLVSLSEIAQIQKGTAFTASKTVRGSVPVIAGGRSPAYYHNKSNRDGNIITISASGAYAGYINHFDTPIFASDCITIKSNNEKELSTKLIFYFLKSIQEDIYQMQRGQTQPHVYADDLSLVKIPLVPKDVQQKIINEIEELEKQAEKAFEVIENQKHKITSKLVGLNHKPSVLGDLADFKNGLNYNRQSSGELITIVGVGDFRNDFSPNIHTLEKVQINGTLSQDYELEPKDILVVRSNGSARLVGRFLYIDELLDKTSYSGFTIRIRVKTKAVDSKYLCYYLKTDFVRYGITKDSKGSNIKSLNQGLLSAIKIPLPPIAKQKQIVAAIEKMERKAETLEKQIIALPKNRTAILKKYLE